MNTFLSLQKELMVMESSDLNVVCPKQACMHCTRSIEIFAQVPRRKEELGMRACMGCIVRSLEAEENTSRLLLLEISVMDSSRVKGCVGII